MNIEKSLLLIPLLLAACATPAASPTEPADILPSHTPGASASATPEPTQTPTLADATPSPTTFADIFAPLEFSPFWGAAGQDDNGNTPAPQPCTGLAATVPNPVITLFTSIALNGAVYEADIPIHIFTGTAGEGAFLMDTILIYAAGTVPDPFSHTASFVFPLADGQSEYFHILGILPDGSAGAQINGMCSTSVQLPATPIPPSATLQPTNTPIPPTKTPKPPQPTDTPETTETPLPTEPPIVTPTPEG